MMLFGNFFGIWFSGNFVSRIAGWLIFSEASTAVEKKMSPWMLAEPGVKAMGLGFCFKNCLRSSERSWKFASSYKGKPAIVICFGQSGCGLAYHCGKAQMIFVGLCHHVLRMFFAGERLSVLRCLLMGGQSTLSVIFPAMYQKVFLMGVGSHLGRYMPGSFAGFVFEKKATGAR